MDHRMPWGETWEGVQLKEIPWGFAYSLMDRRGKRRKDARLGTIPPVPIDRWQLGGHIPWIKACRLRMCMEKLKFKNVCQHHFSVKFGVLKPLFWGSRRLGKADSRGLISRKRTEEQFLDWFFLQIFRKIRGATSRLILWLVRTRRFDARVWLLQY